MGSVRWDFLLALTVRRILDRHVGSVSVAFWVFLSPMVPLLTSLLIFYYIARVPDVAKMGALGYIAFALSGLTAYRFVQRAAGEGCDLVLGNMELLKSASLPLPFLSLSSVGSLAFEFALQTTLVIVVAAWAGVNPSWNLLLLVPAAALFLAAAVGLSWIASIAGLVARESQEGLNLLFLGLLYVTPALYPREAAPPALQRFIDLNPMTHFVIVYRDAVLPQDGVIHGSSWLYLVVIAAVTFSVGLTAIRRAQRVVGDLV
jgi:ABC-type polysaccharide/polyol phosphate export permease